VKFNINDTVRVRLTDYGRAVLREDWQSTTNIYYASQERRAIRGEYKPPKEDAHGWSEWQLWALMEAFGEHTGHGCRLSFETEIEISSAEVERLTAELARLRAEVAALKAERDALAAKADPLADMWAALSEYQPQADRDGHGESWRVMCAERTAAAAWAAAAEAAAAAAWAAADAADAAWAAAEAAAAWAAAAAAWAAARAAARDAARAAAWVAAWAAAEASERAWQRAELERMLAEGGGA